MTGADLSFSLLHMELITPVSVKTHAHTKAYTFNAFTAHFICIMCLCQTAALNREKGAQ